MIEGALALATIASALLPEQTDKTPTAEDGDQPPMPELWGDGTDRPFSHPADEHPEIPWP